MSPATTELDLRVRDAAAAALLLRRDLIFTPHEFDGQPGFMIEDPLRSKFYRVGLAEYTLLSLLDGATTVRAAIGLAAARLGPQALGESEALALCRWAVDCELATSRDSELPERLIAGDDRRAAGRWAAWLNPLAMKLPLATPDRLLAAALPWCGWLFGGWAFCVWLIVCGWGGKEVLANWNRLADSAGVLFDPGNWLRIAVVWLGLKVLHEAAHAICCKRFGGQVGRAGVMLVLLAPVAYTEVTSSWRFTKWQRIATAAAGMYAEFFIAAIAIIFWSYTGEGLAHRLAFDAALMASLNTLLFNANPLLRFDGYYILSDLLEIPNLSAAGRQFVVWLFGRYVFGIDAVLPEWSPRTGRRIKVYGLAAFAWRIVIYLSMALVVIAWLSYLGGLLVGLFALLAFGVPAWRGLREMLRSDPSSRSWGWRLARVGLVVGLPALALAALLCRPGTVATPAVVEYAPVTEIRARTPGFVREVPVQAGQLVEAGQIIAILENDELSTQRADLAGEIQQSDIKARIEFNEGELAKSQAEEANRQSLVKKQSEIVRQIADLTIRAPRRGRINGRQMDSLVGQYLEPGREIAILGGEETKELVLAVGQDDIDSCRAQLGGLVEIRIRGDSWATLTAPLAQIEPQAGLAPPHPALSARAGGPLPIKAKALPRDEQAESQRRVQVDELLQPRFKATVPLTPAQSLALYAGQPAQVTFPSRVETWGGRLWRTFAHWIDDQLLRARSSKQPAAT